MCAVLITSKPRLATYASSATANLTESEVSAQLNKILAGASDDELDIIGRFIQRDRCTEGKRQMSARLITSWDDHDFYHCSTVLGPVENCTFCADELAPDEAEDEPAMTIKIRVDSANAEHVRVTVFAGENTLANVGSLCLRVGKYQLFGAALAMGAERTNGALTIVHDDSKFRAMAGERA